MYIYFAFVSLHFIVKALNTPVHRELAAYLLIYGLMVVFIMGLLFLGGLFTDFYLAFILIPLLSHLLLSNRVFYINMALSLGIGLIILYLELQHNIVYPPPFLLSPATEFLSKSTFIILTASYVKLLRNASDMVDLMRSSREQEEAVKMYDEHLSVEQQFNQLSNLAIGIAHDVASVLTVIQNYHDLLAQTENIEDLEEVKQITQQAVDLNDLLMKFSRGIDVTENEIVNLKEHIEASKLYYTKIAGRYNTVIIEIDNGAGNIRIHPAHLDQIISNLVINAKESMKDNGEIRIRVLSDIIDSQNYTCIQIIDNGMGISKTVQKHIFKPFFTTKADSGRGVGLSSVKQIADRYSAIIDVSSELGKGTTFTVHFPRVDTPVN